MLWDKFRNTIAVPQAMPDVLSTKPISAIKAIPSGEKMPPDAAAGTHPGMPDGPAPGSDPEHGVGNRDRLWQQAQFVERIGHGLLIGYDLVCDRPDTKALPSDGDLQHILGNPG